MKALRFARFGDPSVLELVNRGDGMPVADEDEVVVEVKAASINPSDVKNVAGLMHMTTLPRTPGRDFAGVVVDGPSEYIGREVWGAGGDLGFTRDGSHAEYVVIPKSAVVLKPENLSFLEAAAAGIAYVTAWHGMVDALKLTVGETLIITGSSGSVGMAAIQIARWMGVKTIGIDRAHHDDLDPKLRPDITMMLSDNVVEDIMKLTGNRGVHAVFDSVGAPVFELCLSLLGAEGRYVLLGNAGPEAKVAVEVVPFYHRRIMLMGIDTLSIDTAAGAKILDHLRAGFENGALRAPAIARTVSLSEARTAYHLKGFSGKTVIDMSDEQVSVIRGS